MTKAIGILLVLLMFALSGCASMDSAGKSAAVQGTEKSVLAPAVVAGTNCEPNGIVSRTVPPYHW